MNANQMKRLEANLAAAERWQRRDTVETMRRDQARWLVEYVELQRAERSAEMRLYILTRAITKNKRDLEKIRREKERLGELITRSREREAKA